MIELRLCRECRHSVPITEISGELKCTNPIVNRKDSFALASGKPFRGSSTIVERTKKWPFGECGMRGALWEKKDDQERN